MGTAINLFTLGMIISIVWVYFDATNNKIGKIKGGGAFSISAGEWFVICCLLWIVAFPIYIFKRSKLIEKAKVNPVEVGNRNIKLIVISLLAAIISFSLFFQNQSGLEETACPTVTEIIKNQLAGSAICKGVKISNKVSDNFYTAVATLDNGNELKITIEERDDGQIYVQVLNQ